MDIILSQDIKQLGKMGDVVKVKEGFARNYLFPRKMAIAATPGNMKRIELQKKRYAVQNEAQKKEAEVLAEKLNKASVTLPVEVNDLEKLYGSVTEADIAKALENEGYSIDKKSIIIENPIQELGIYEIGVKLHSDVTAKLRLWVTKK